MPRYAKSAGTDGMRFAEFAADPGDGWTLVADTDPTRPSLNHRRALVDGVVVWVDNRTLAEVKAAARQRMASAWFAAKADGVTLGTKTAPTDPDSWTRYLAIKLMAADGGWVDMPIPLKDGSFELLTQAKAATLWTALKAMERALLAQLRDRVDAINAATTIPDVEAIVWSE